MTFKERYWKIDFNDLMLGIIFPIWITAGLCIALIIAPQVILKDHYNIVIPVLIFGYWPIKAIIYVIMITIYKGVKEALR